MDGIFAFQRSDFTVFQYAQQPGLDVDWQLADFIQKNRAVIGQDELAGESA